jgi:FkbM family methyltransferase
VFLKTALKRALLQCGYSVQRVPILGHDPFTDMRRFTSTTRPLVFDVGANTGQSVIEFREHFESSEIHSFEPGEKSFEELQSRTQGMGNLHLVQCAMGARRESKTFIETKSSDYSSFFEPSAEVPTPVTGRRELALDTIDDYCKRAGIQHIDIFKSDTQGYDLEVLRGASEMLSGKRINLVYIEVIFSKMYLGAPRFDEIYAFLAEHGMALVAFYDMHYNQDLLSWTNVLFRAVAE